MVAKAEDCLICLSALRTHYKPTELDCACKPPLHRACWDRWVQRAGARCVICRKPEPPEEPAPRAILVVMPIPNEELFRSPEYVLTIILAGLLIFMTFWYSLRRTQGSWDHDEL